MIVILMNGRIERDGDQEQNNKGYNQEKLILQNPCTVFFLTYKQQTNQEQHVRSKTFL